MDWCSYVCISVLVLFLFFKQKTAYEMRISDWSSDVCSSDLHPQATRRYGYAANPTAGVATGHRSDRAPAHTVPRYPAPCLNAAPRAVVPTGATDRKSVV